MLPNIGKMVKQLGCWQFVVSPTGDGGYCASLGSHDINPTTGELEYTVYDNHTATMRSTDDAIWLLEAQCELTLHMLERGTALLGQ